MAEWIQIITTSDKKEILQQMARRLIDDQLAACVQIGGPVESVFRWQGTVESASEWTCSIKSVSARIPDIESVIRLLHNYDEPEIAVLPVVGGSESYARWVQQQVGD